MKGNKEQTWVDQYLFFNLKKAQIKYYKMYKLVHINNYE